MRKTFLLIIAFHSANLLQAQLLKGDRILSYSVSYSETQTFDESFQFAQSNCMDMIHLQYPWGNYEVSEGVFDQEQMELMDITDIYFPAYNMPLELNIGTMNTTVNAIPNDLLETSYDSPIMIERFKSFLDTIFSKIPNVEIGVLTIGNEADIYMGTDENQYNAYKTFLNEVIPYAKQKYFTIHGEPLKVGTTLTLEAITDPVKGPLCHILNDNLDIVSTTYYPLLPGFQMNAPSAVHNDFNELVVQYSDTTQPIYIVECGYATSDECGSNETMQGQFFMEVFDAWDDHYDNIKLISIFKIADWSQEEVEVLGEYYGLSDLAFLEYLRTLGIRTYAGNGEDKLSVDILKCALEARNWCATTQCALGIEEFTNYAISIYPNPSKGIVNVDLGELSNESIHMIIHNSLGQKVYQKRYKNQNKVELNISDWPKGFYTITIRSKTAQSDYKVLINKI